VVRIYNSTIRRKEIKYGGIQLKQITMDMELVLLRTNSFGDKQIFKTEMSHKEYENNLYTNTREENKEINENLLGTF
jgi:hypothetical protein